MVWKMSPPGRSGGGRLVPRMLEDVVYSSRHLPLTSGLLRLARLGLTASTASARRSTCAQEL